MTKNFVLPTAKNSLNRWHDTESSTKKTKTHCTRNYTLIAAAVASVFCGSICGYQECSIAKDLETITAHSEYIPLSPVAMQYAATHKIPTRDEIITTTLATYGKDGIKAEITPELIKAIIEVESAGEQLARSSKGAIGLMQIMPLHTQTLRAAGIITKEADLWQEEQNIQAGIYILMQYAKHAKNITHALACYNAGAKKADRGAGRGYANKVLAMARTF